MNLSIKFLIVFIIITIISTLVLSDDGDTSSKIELKSSIDSDIELSQSPSNINNEEIRRPKRDGSKEQQMFHIHIHKKRTPHKYMGKVKTIHLYPEFHHHAEPKNSDFKHENDHFNEYKKHKQHEAMMEKKVLLLHDHNKENDESSVMLAPDESQEHHHYVEHQHKAEHIEKIKIKHHHHHHHHNHIKTVVKKEPYPVEKIIHVPKPYAVEKVVHVDKPYPVEKIVEKIIHVPKPYPVEKIIEKIVHVPVEKIVHVPKPYPVEKIVEKIVHVPKPYPVEKIIEKIVHVPKHIIKHIHVPMEIKVPVEKLVPYPVEKKVPYPVKVYVPIEKKSPPPPKHHSSYGDEHHQNHYEHNHQHHHLHSQQQLPISSSSHHDGLFSDSNIHHSTQSTTFPTSYQHHDQHQTHHDQHINYSNKYTRSISPTMGGSLHFGKPSANPQSTNQPSENFSGRMYLPLNTLQINHTQNPIQSKLLTNEEIRTVRSTVITEPSQERTTTIYGKISADQRPIPYDQLNKYHHDDDDNNNDNFNVFVSPSTSLSPKITHNQQQNHNQQFNNKNANQQTIQSESRTDNIFHINVQDPNSNTEIHNQLPTAQALIMEQNHNQPQQSAIAYQIQQSNHQLPFQIIQLQPYLSSN